MARLLWLVCIAALLLVTVPKALVADEPENNDADWLTWTVKDCKGDTLDLSDHEDKTVYVVVFTPGNSDSCTLMRNVAAYIRGHTNKANKVLGFCCDDTGCDAIKLHIRQEEYRERTDAWKVAEDAARLAAQQANQPFNPSPLPDFEKQIKDEMNNANDFNVLIARHLPFKTCQRCAEMWSWLVERMAQPEGAPRLLKINAQGKCVQEWSVLPTNFSAD